MAKPKMARPRIMSARISGEFCRTHWRRRWRDFTFAKRVNILCGPNGCGKSTVLKALFPQPKKRDGMWADNNIEEAIFLDTIKVRVQTTGGMVRRFDFEANNPRVQRGYGLMEPRDFAMSAHRGAARAMSHGESQKKLFDNLLSSEAVYGAMILLDEPEQALDIDGLVHLREILRGARSQFIIATHSPLLILEPQFNIIEMVPGYQDKIRKFVSALVSSTSS